MELHKTTVLSLVHTDFEDLELMYPVLRLREAGVTVHIAGEERSRQYTGKYGIPVESDIDFNEVDVNNYHGLLIPGGWAPDKLRRFSSVIDLVQNFHADNKLIAHICHAGWVLVSAKIINGYTVTSTPGIKDDMINAGATWIDRPVVVDRNIISSRRPADLPNFMREVIKFLYEYHLN